MTQVEKGKAFEYALALNISELTEIPIAQNKALNIAKRCYDTQTSKVHMDNAALESTIFLQCHDERINDPKQVILQEDVLGRLGDVRDIVIFLDHDEIGISAKHNHQAVKHSRLSDTIDFGKEWGGHPVSSKYWRAVKPVFMDLRNKKGQLFVDIPNKATTYYLSVLTAFEDELRRLCEDFGRQFTKLFFQYLLGTEDYYKVVCQPNHVSIQPTNINGTLKWGKKWKIPDRIEQIRRKQNSNNTLLVSFEGGWQLSFRIHNASARIEPSLKFDIQFVGLPQNVTRHEIPLV